MSDSKTILLVENDAAVHADLVKNLKKLGYEVIVSPSWEEAAHSDEKCVKAFLTSSEPIIDITEWAHTEEDLQILKQSIDNAPDAVYWLDKDGYFLYVNEMGFKTLGYTRNELLNLHVSRVNPRAGKERWYEVWQTIKEKGSITIESIHRRKDGSEFPVELTSAYFKFGEKEYCNGFAKDISGRKVAEAAVIRAQEKYRALFSEMSYGAALHEIVVDSRGNSVDYVTLEVNEAFENFLNCPKEFVIGKKASDILPPEELTHWLGIFGPVAITGKSRHYKMYSPLNDKHFEGTVYCPEIGQFAVVFSDITDHKQAEEALRVSEQRFRSIFESSIDGVMLNAVDGSVLAANKQMCHIVGMTEDEIKTVGRQGLVVDSEKLQQALEEINGTGSFKGELSLQRKDGSIVPVEVSSGIFEDADGRLLASTIVRDITIRKMAEQSLAESQGHLLAMMNSTSDMIWSVDSEKFGLLTFNEAYRDFWFSQGGIDVRIGMTADDLVPPNHAEKWKGYYSQALKEGHFSADTPDTEYTSSARSKVFSFSMNVIKRGDDIFGISVFAKDVTDRKKLEEQLRQAQKMEAIGTLAGGVAHDFNNLLTVIKGFANLIQMTTSRDDQIRPYSDEIVEASNRAADLTRSLLAYSRKQRIDPEPHDINQVVKSSVKLLGRLLPEDIELKVHLADGEMFSKIDITQINQVLMNLATNARDAMSAGGTLTIRTQGATIDERFVGTHGFGKPGRYVNLSVADTGIGIDQGMISRIFDPFFTTKEVGKGTGLGLASVYGIVKQHDGYVIVTSKLSVGSCFDMYLPMVSGHETKEETPDMEIREGRENILIIEDDPAVRNMIALMLQRGGYSTHLASDGESAVHLFEEMKERIHLVILDVVMPRMNGREVFERIKKIDPLVKVIFVSGYTGDVVLNKGIEHQKVDFLQKPLSAEKLYTKVREVLDRR
jgi:two-component system, cell cycle sensor histidine kinase and response regulator CckA